jgi:ribose transport system substrate-binding protein
VTRTASTRNAAAYCAGLLTLGASVAVVGCKTKPANSAADSTATGKTIGVTLLTREDEFYRELEQGLRAAAAQHGYKIILTSGDRDLDKQESQIDNFIVQHVDAIVVCPVDTKGIGPAIDKANAAKIPVFTADIAAQHGQVVSHVASDNLAGGRLAAEYIAQAIGDSGDVGVIGENDVQTTIDRQQGFADGLKSHPKIHLVASLDGSGVRDRSLKAADDLLQAHPNVRAIFAINDESALGTLSAAQSSKKTSLIIVGYDAAPEAQKAILGGTPLRADVAQQPSLIGQKTIDAIAQYFAGQTPAARIAVPVKIVTADSLRAASAATAAGASR